MNSIYLKYSNDESMSVPFNEIITDFSKIKPTFNPILDICTIKTLGSYITNVTNFQKWKICPNLADEIITSNQMKTYNVNKQDIISIITKAQSKYKQPLYTINEVYYYVSDLIKDSLDMKNADDVAKYFEMKSDYNTFLNQIKLKYHDDWNNIEKQYEIVSETLFENFSQLENDLNFEGTIEVIESINTEACKKIDKLIKNTSILIKENNLQNESQIKIDFDKQMDDIYEGIVASRKFDKSIHEIILDMYGVEKAIHRMSLSFEFCSNIFKKILDKTQ
jgi:hypothetical protein